MANKGHSERGLFGGYNHYDENGKKTGHSEPGLFGGYINYDKNGKRTGRTEPGLFGGYNHYDANGKKTGHSEPGLFGGYTNYDKNGKVTGHSDPGLFNSYNHSDGGCYVATCVYGSYDCPPVWTLRRYRDRVLAKKAAGRAFIRFYYAVSPTAVRLFGKCRLFRRFFRRVLDPVVEKLNGRGFENTPYRDK